MIMVGRPHRIKYSFMICNTSKVPSSLLLSFCDNFLLKEKPLSDQHFQNAEVKSTKPAFLDVNIWPYCQFHMISYFKPNMPLYQLYIHHHNHHHYHHHHHHQDLTNKE